MRELLNTKQVADYLGINEKKVYNLAKSGKLPCTRVTGKWVFPRNLIDEWIEEHSRGAVRNKTETPRKILLGAGSDDPGLGILRNLYAARAPGSPLFTATTGSSAGLAAVQDGVADFALSHLLDTESGEYNIPFVRKAVLSRVAVVPLFHRELGLLVAAGNPRDLRTPADLARAGIRMINRQEGSGTRHYLDHQLAKLGIDPNAIDGYDKSVVTHVEVGLKILKREVDAGIATKAAANLLGLDFIPLVRERFDMLILKDRFFSPGISTLLEIVGAREFRASLGPSDGYDTSESGRIIASA
jgi:putative molybdopterin biosynthesis protein